MKKLLDFLEKLESADIYYRLNKARDAVMVEIAVPGQRWEVEFFADGRVEAERFISEGIIHGESELDVLFREFSE